MNCNQCGRRVKDDFKAKWNHMVKYHPRIAMRKIVTVLCDEAKAEAVGSILAKELLKCGAPFNETWIEK